MKKLNLLRTIILAGSLLLQLAMFSLHSHGAAGDVDLSFDPGSGVNGLVTGIVVQPDGKVIISGEFNTVKGLVRTNLARLNADGSGDSSFNPVVVPDTFIDSLAVQTDGKVLIGGYIRTVEIGSDGYPYWVYSYFLRRLNANGSADGSFSPTVDRHVGSSAIQSDGKVLISGDFTSINGTNRNGIARLNGNGSLDTGFDPGAAANGDIYLFALQSDGKIIIAGGFTSINGTSRNRIARLNTNGSLDSSFNPGAGPNGGIGSVVLQPDGKVLLHGSFSKVNNTNRKGIARLNANGTLDGSFNPDAGAINPYGIHYVAAPSGGKVIVWGDTNVNGTNRFRVLCFLENGSVDNSFNSGAGANSYIARVASQSDGKIFLGGNFTTVNGTERRNLARLNTNGTLDGSFDSGANIDSFTSLALQPDGKVLLGDAFTFINGTNRYGKFRLNANGSADGSFVSDTLHSNMGTLYTNFMADGVLVAPPVRQSDGKIIFGGGEVYVECGDVGCAYYTSPFLNRFNANGSFDTNFQPITPYFYFNYESVQALALQPDGKIIVAGYFNTLGTNLSGLARLNANGSVDASFAPATGLNAGLSSVALQPDGKVLIAGFFGNINGTFPYGVARLNANGSFDNSFNSILIEPSFNSIQSLALQPDGKVLIAGSFTSINGTNRNRIARLNSDGSLDGSFNPGTGPDGLVRSMVLQPDGKVLVGGDFFSVNGVARPHVARVYGDFVVAPLPSLSITRSNAFAIISWPASATGYHVEESTNLSLANSWSPVAQTSVTNAEQISTAVPASGRTKFFRLKSQ